MSRAHECSHAASSAALAERRGRRPLAALATITLTLACVALALLSALLWHRILNAGERLSAVEQELSTRRSLAEAVTQQPEDARARLRLGIYLAQNRHAEAAEVQLAAAYGLQPKDPLLSFSLGRFYLENGRSRKALPLLERAAVLDEKNAHIRLHLGLAYLNLDQPQSARRELEEAARLDPGIPEVHLGLALVYSDRATAKRALAEIEEYIRRATDPSVGRVLLSRSYYHLQQIPEAIQAARLAVQDQPKSPLAWQALALALMEGSVEERAEAEACFRRTIELSPAFADAHIGLARAYLRRKAYPEAAREFETAIALDPTAGYVQYELGQAYQGAGRTGDAGQQFRGADAYMAYKRQVVAVRRAIVQDPRNASLYLKLARLYASRGAYDWALPSIERALRLKPGDAGLLREQRRLQEMARD